MTAINDIAFERQRQIIKGFDAEHDDVHTDGSIQICALNVLASLDSRDQEGWTGSRANHIVGKYTTRQQLVIAAAMLVAEIERLDRLPKVCYACGEPGKEICDDCQAHGEP